MHLDVATLIVVIVFINTMAGLLMMLSWLHSRSVTALLYWGAGYLFGAVAAALLGGRGSIPDIWSIVLANAVLIYAYGFTWSGLRNFDDRPVKPWQIAAGGVVWLIACSVPAFYDSIQFRATLGSLIAVVYAVMGVIELWRGRHDGLMSRWLAIAMIAFQAVVYSLRIVGVWCGGVPANADLLQLNWLPIGLFEGLFYSFGAAFILLTMAKERAEQRHKLAAFIDPLTGVPNRRGFFDQANDLLARCRDEGRPVMLLLFDLDHFKRINDTFGHQAGDEILIAFCRTAQARLGPHDVFARLGGEEFVCLAPYDSSHSAFALGERIRDEFAAAHGQDRADGVQATVSVGLASSVECGRDLPSLLGAADRALYQAKAKGRNRVEGRRGPLAVVAGSAVAPTVVPLGAA